MKLELRQLTYFVAVAEELNFGRAARRLRVAQPSLSRQIQQLERGLGAQLLSRTTREVRLTQAGALLLDEARRTLRQAERTITAVERAGSGIVGNLEIGYVGAAGVETLPKIVRAVRSAHPEIELVLREMYDEEILARLARSQIDAGILRVRNADPSIQFEEILREPLCAVLPADHALARRKRLRLEALAHEPFVVWPRELAILQHDALMQLCRRHGFTPTIAQEGISHGILGLVAAGLGVSVLGRCYRAMGRADIVFIPLDHCWSVLSLVWRRDDASPVLARFIDVARAAAA